MVKVGSNTCQVYSNRFRSPYTDVKPSSGRAISYRSTANHYSIIAIWTLHTTTALLRGIGILCLDWTTSEDFWATEFTLFRVVPCSPVTVTLFWCIAFRDCMKLPRGKTARRLLLMSFLFLNSLFIDGIVLIIMYNTIEILQ